ncbi:MAG: hypothetical protein ABSF85_10910 [Terriglobales bacterium]
MWDKSFRGKRLVCWAAFHGAMFHRAAFYLRMTAAFLLLTAAAVPSHGREKNVLQYGEGLIINIPLPEPEVAQVVEEAVQDTIIRGTKEYNKDEYVAGAVAATSTPAFPKWTEDGRVFYKVRKQALDPRNFKDSTDVGTLAVRYVVKPQGDKNTVLRIDAIFVEDFRRVAHPSNGSVESAEYQDIQDRLASIELVKKETAEALRIKQERLAKQKTSPDSNVSSNKDGGVSSNNDSDKELFSTPPSTAMASDSMNGESPEGAKTTASTSQSSPSTMPYPAPTYQESGETLEQHIAELREQLERLVKQPGAPLKSAPFHTATTLKSLQPGVEVLIQITTPYWYGVETHDGDQGWMRRDQLERLP